VNKVRLVLTMAGRYTRFREFSYEIPKYLLPLSNRTVIHYVLKNFLETGEFDDLLLVANKRDMRFRPQLVSTLQEFGYDASELIFIDDTDGQSLTAAEGLRHANHDDAVVVHNIDTILWGRDFSSIKKQLETASCVLDVFTANNDAYSYVLSADDDPQQITAIIEKETVSNVASSGCYCFRSGKELLKYIDRAAEDKRYYMSAAISEMIGDGLSVRSSDVCNEQNTIVLGTPKEYISAISTFDLLSGVDG
tara:strand:+ start:4043 stop:4792 length:750 start_codon:yes stop_codon:yes gene_type:complete